MKNSVMMTTINSLLAEDKIYSPKELTTVLKRIGILKPVKDNKRVLYYNIPVAFDIETSSFKVQSTELDDPEPQKRGIMYIWTLSICGLIIQGRTWEEFIDVCNELSRWYKLSEHKRLCIYIHNLSYEFQFMHKYFNFINVFSLKKREPIRALTINGIEFRCSYALSGYSLAKVGENLTQFKIRKLKGDLDYSLIRHSKTPLTREELQYCINDVQIIIAYITEYLERVQYIFNIPMTKTGVVRKLTRENCMYEKDGSKSDKFHKYRELMRELTITDEEYILLKRCFAGGFTHANSYYVGEVIQNVHSKDFTSSYPAVMVAEKFPMSRPEKVSIKSEAQFRRCLKNYCCLFEIEVFNLYPKIKYENYIQQAHCRELKNPIVNNGRVVTADHLKLTVTEQDYFIIEQYYGWENLNIFNFHTMVKGYLPTDFVKTIIKLYEDKTQLKGIEDKAVEYLQSKENLNSLYGMTVTDPCRDEIKYSSVNWTAEKPDLHEAIQKNNKSIKRFLYYPWGVWVTAYARYNLFTAITELGEDYIYSDTDSVKYINYEKHEDYFNSYNEYITNKIKKALIFHKIDPNRAAPKTIKGEPKQLGVWDDEGTYSRFKTLGAKRYMVEKDGVINITVSGLNKGVTVPYLKVKYGESIFDEFKEGLYIPPKYTGKLTHTYIDEEKEGYIEDYLGRTEYYHELSAVHLEPAEYTLSMNELFLNYLLGIEDRTNE